jgi:hypothetical protein
MTTVFKSESQPDWGMGLVIEDGADHWVIFFEHGGRKKFIKSKTKGLVAVTPDPRALAALETRSHGRAARAAPNTRAKPKKPGLPRKAVARFGSLAQQILFFEKLFPGGFEGETFTNSERGVAGVTKKGGKSGNKEAAIALAREELSAAKFTSATPEELFESAARLLKGTNIVFPLEGAIPFGEMDAKARAAAVAGLKQLLHGEGDYGLRVERFTGAVALKNKKGEAKVVSWPLATIFGALFNPAVNSCIKPAPFACQAATLGLVVDQKQAVNARAYTAFHEVVTLTHAKLLEAGQKPRDLLDVSSFIWRTHAEKPTETV